MNIRLFFNELLVTSARYHNVLITFGFKCEGKQTKTDDNETKNKKAKSKNSKMSTYVVLFIDSNDCHFHLRGFRI